MSHHQLTGFATRQLAHDAPSELASDNPLLDWRVWAGHRLRELAPFLAVATEFLLIVLLVQQFRLESQTFLRLMQLAFAGFLIHHFLPLGARRGFFALLSVAVTVAVVDDVAKLTLFGSGMALVAIGMGLIGICHLPMPFWARVGLLGIVGATLAVIRANFQWFPKLEGMWVVLASMFVFRIMVYLYDLKHHNLQFGIAHAISYFFMLPNACFPLFPIVDYKTFCLTYYNDDAIRIYQTGINWMFRGIIHLLLYRLIYHYGLLNISDVRNAGDVAKFMVATYLLYLRVSGQFHLIVGLLHMFGFNLPETHHLYLLASSFTDFWRRINIYWKDFIMKLFFYPAFFALPRIGTVRAIAIATVAAFLATWALHSWQWFWFRGRFLLTWQDISFWAILAVLVLVNVVHETIFGRRRALTKPAFDLWSRLVVGLKTIGTFVTICALWTLWDCKSGGELLVLAECAARVSWNDAAMILAGLTVIGVSGAIWGGTVRDSSAGLDVAAKCVPPYHFWRSAIPIGAGTVCALALSTVDLPDVSGAVALLAVLRGGQLNAVDLDWQRRGYYEELEVARGNQLMWQKISLAPPGWTNNEILFRRRDGFIHREMIPSTSAVLCGLPATTNRWGMRDRDYDKDKPADTFRLMLFGSSHEVGYGVKEHETFENLVEDRLNREQRGERRVRIEILNMSVGGLSIFEKLCLLQEDGFDFGPDAIIFAVCATDRSTILEQLARALGENRPIPFDYLKDLFRRAGVDGRWAPQMIQHRLEPYVPEMYDWLFARLRNECAQRGIRAFVLYRPAPIAADSRDTARREELISRANHAGLEVLDLGSAFDQVKERSTLVVAPWDTHTNAIGHRLLAGELFNQLASQLGSTPLDGSYAPP